MHILNKLVEKFWVMWIKSIHAKKVLRFKNGITFETRIQNDGRISIKLVQYGEEIFDFKDTLEEEILFLLNFLNTIEPWKVKISSFESAVIYVETIRGPEEILSLFHEIGHVKNSELSELSLETKNDYGYECLKDSESKYPEKRIKALKRAWKINSVSERAAWAYSLHKVRNIERTFNISIISKMKGGVQGTKRYVQYYLNAHENYFLSCEPYYLGYKTRDSAREFLNNC